MRQTRVNAVLVLVAMTALCLSATTVMAQPGRGGGGRPGGGGFGGGFGGNGALDVAVRDDVQKHLELLPDQVDDLKKLAETERAAQRERMQGLFSGFDRNASDEDRAAAREKVQAVLRKAAAETQAKVDQILLPHQAKRLSQLVTQRQLRGGISGAFGSEELTGKLGISSSQREDLQAKARAAEEQLREQVAALREKMQADLLKSLSPAQQAKYKDLIGEPFEFAAEERGGRGQAGGRQEGGRPTGGRPTGRPTTGRPTRGQRPAQ